MNSRSNSWAGTPLIAPPPGRHTRAEIDLDAISHNVRQLIRRAHPAQLMTVVKGNAYGHGAVEIAREAVAAGASWLGVYTAHEGLALRAAGITSPILVLGPLSSTEAGAVLGGGLTPTINSLDTALAINRLARATVPFHTEIDTGMHRAGVETQKAAGLLNSIAELEHLQLQGLYMHFATADEHDLSSAGTQLARFEAVLSHLATIGVVPEIIHASNSAALFSMPNARFDLVRIGIATYGYNPAPDTEPSPDLRPALQLISEVVRVHTVGPGEGVGYGRAFQASRPTLIALVPAGYADGLSRAMGQGRSSVLIRGRMAPIVGRVSMDQITVDVSAIPEVEPRDEVVIIGEQGPASRWADTVATAIDTISYEVLTSLMPRVPRIYMRGGEPIRACTFPTGDS